MIHSIKCNRSTFKTINFNPHFNVVLAERTKESTIKDSRNGLGKSTLIEIIHFMLGANKGETLSKPDLDDWTFTMEIDLLGKKCSITRNTTDANKIIIEGDCGDWPIKPTTDKKTGNQILSRNDWNNVLGTLMFDVQSIYEEYKYVPTFRSLISYFIRRNGQSGAFLEPFKQFGTQKEWDKQVNNAYLLELGWEYASKWQILKDRVKVLNQLKSESESGVISDMIGSTGELDSKKIRLEAKIRNFKEQLDSFKVHPQYSHIEDEANRITSKIHEMVNDSINDKRLIEHYETSLKEEVDADPELISKVYKEAGLLLPEQMTKRLDDVMRFHKSIVQNRKSFLKNEIDRLKHNITQRDQEINNLSSRRVELMLVLKDHGALHEYTQLQNNYQVIISELKDVEIKLENMRKFEQGKSSIKIEQELLQQQAINDLSDRKSQKENAILTFNSYSQTLYDESGTLSIDVSETGYKFNVKIERSGSHGIGNMKIFCYDLMLAKLWAKKTNTPIILVHDSILFADVDERQKALALQLAKDTSEKEGFQYICTMNSDNIPRKDFDPNFKFDSYVVEKLTDATPDGGLLGIRF